jgi:cysteine synthase
MSERRGILKAIGNTPLVRLDTYSTGNVEIWAKLEGTNPGGSVKDRTALYLIEDAEQKGELPGKEVIEPTSGNTGMGLAMVCAVKGYPITVVMPESMSIERRQILRAFWAKLELTPGELGTDGAIDRAHEMVNAEPERYFMPNQFDNPANVKAHYETTGREIWEQTKGELSVFVAGIGTSGTLMGTGKYLKKQNPAIRVIGVEPGPNHGIQGLKSLEEARIPTIFDPSLPDDMLRVEDKDALRLARELPQREGIFVGISSGAALCAALKAASQLEEGRIVVVFPDGGERYLSTGLFPA